MAVDWLPLTQPALVFVTVFVLILLAPIAAQRLRLPGIIGLILAGVLVGPLGLGLLERDGAIVALGEAGLLYLMFLGGLDLDLEGFAEHKRDSALFGTSTTILPMLVNTAACLALGFSVAAALLIASALTSHTLVNYPLVQRFGLSKNRAVTATLGATLPANVTALLILAVVAGVYQGNMDLRFWLPFGLGLLGLVGLTVWGLPRLTRWFFANLGHDRNTRFIYVLVMLFAMAAFASVTGVEAIVGAFLAGLALNRFVPEGSALMERINLLGNVLLVPMFLIATGMLVDPVELLRDPQILLVGAVLTVTALLAKLLAALPAGRVLRASRAELGVMFSLSGAQAAGTIAAVVVGLGIGLVDQQAVNAMVLVVLGTVLVTAAIGQRSTPLVPRPQRRAGRLGEMIVVPIANPDSVEPLMRLASLIAAPETGQVTPVAVVPFEASAEEIDERREVTDKAEQLALGNGVEARGTVRVDVTPAAGVLHTVVEGGATAVLLGWKGHAGVREHFFGGIIDSIIARLRVPAMVCRTGIDDRVGRVVLSVTLGDLGAGGRPGLELATDVAQRLARSAQVPLAIVSEYDDARLRSLVTGPRPADLRIDPRKPTIALREHTRPGDVVVIGTPPARAGLGQNARRLAQAIPDRSVLAVVPCLNG